MSRALPQFTIFVRHSQDCPHRGDETYKKCSCWKHIRWFGRNPWIPDAPLSDKQYTRATKEKTWAGAERFKDEMRAEYNPSRAIASAEEAVTVEQAIKLFMAEKEGQNLSDSVIHKYRLELQRLNTFLEMQNVFRLQDVRLPHLTAFRSTWPALYPSTITRSRAQQRLKGFFKYACFAYNVPKNPASGGKGYGLTPIKVDSMPTLPLQPEQYTALLAATDTLNPLWRTRMHALASLMRWSGLAIQDAVCLERDKIKQDDSQPRIVTRRVKTNVLVSVPIPLFLAEELRAVANGNPKYIFWTGACVPRTATGRYGRIFKTLFEKAKIADGHSHRLRDTAAVEWLKAGVSLLGVSTLLGHSNIKTTQESYSPWVQDLQDQLNESVTRHWPAEYKR